MLKLKESNLKNGGTCSDNEGKSKFICTCTPQFDGGRCEIDRCNFYECQNNGTCIVDAINNIPTPRCDCPETHHGATCHLERCLIPCYNGGVCDGETCQCSQENGIAKYYGVSCDMPIACNGNPCQNGGTCSINTEVDDDIQVYVINNVKTICC